MFSGPGANYHTDAEQAKKLGFPNIVVQGMMSTCFAAQVMQDAFGTGFVEGGKLSLKLVNVLWCDESVVARARVREREREGTRTRVHCDVGGRGTTTRILLATRVRSKTRQVSRAVAWRLRAALRPDCLDRTLPIAASAASIHGVSPRRRALASAPQLRLARPSRPARRGRRDEAFGTLARWRPGARRPGGAPAAPGGGSRAPDLQEAARRPATPRFRDGRGGGRGVASPRPTLDDQPSCCSLLRQRAVAGASGALSDGRVVRPCSQFRARRSNDSPARGLLWREDA
jgi:hypothetical protein